MNAEPAQLVFSFSPGIPSEIVWAEREHWWYRASGLIKEPAIWASSLIFALAFIEVCLGVIFDVPGAC